MLKVYNTLSREKEKFSPLKEGQVTMYCCGPTVYDEPHLGNYRSFVMNDNIRRYLEFSGYEVHQVVNITDIDDKTIQRSAEMGEKLEDYTRRYEQIFFEGLDRLNILPAEKYPRATENVQSMIDIVEVLVEKGYAYESKGSVYFDISKFHDYGKLSGVDLNQVRVGARVDVDEYGKNNPRDFVLLKRSTDSEIERGIFFDSPWGKVRPGWHMECSTLSMKYLGKTIDIHTGGVDLVFPHHENEIAQSESYTGQTFVRYWLHGQHLMVDGEKMSKSLGNIVRIDDVLDRYSVNVLRYMFASTHYRRILDYTQETIENAENNCQRLLNAYQNLNFALRTSNESEEEMMEEMADFEKRFRDAMDDDFNTPLALGVFHELAKSINGYLQEARNEKVLGKCKEAFDRFASVFGLQFPEPPNLTAEQTRKIRERERAREMRDWETADNLRSELEEDGLIIEDTDWGTKWSRAS